MTREAAQKVAAIVQDAGGQVVGRTRLQKVAYLLEAAGLGDGFLFEYRHYGPYSEDLSAAARDADLLGLLQETEHPATWGGVYSIYVAGPATAPSTTAARRQLASEAAQADSIDLELAATAVFLAKDGYSDPWSETARRKPEKAGEGRLNRARALYRRLQKVSTPIPLPAF